MLCSSSPSSTVRSHNDHRTAFLHDTTEFHPDFRFFVLSPKSSVLPFLPAVLELTLLFVPSINLSSCYSCFHSLSGLIIFSSRPQRFFIPPVLPRPLFPTTRPFSPSNSPGQTNFSPQRPLPTIFFFLPPRNRHSRQPTPGTPSIFPPLATHNSLSPSTTHPPDN